MTTSDGTPTVTTDGDPVDSTTAPAPSADTGESTSETPEGPTSMVDAVAAGLKAEDDSSKDAPEGESGDNEVPASDASAQGQETTPEDPESQTPADETSATAGDDKGDESAEQGEDPELSEDVTEAELEAAHPKAAKRIRQLLQQRFEFRQEAEQARPVMEFIRQNGLQGDDVNLALGVVAKLQQGDFRGFYEDMRPYMAAAEQMLGQALPADLDEQVRKGLISEQLARELAQSRANSAWQESQRTQERQSREESDAAQEAAQLRTVIARSVTDWENQVRQRDPDYARKEPVIRRFAQALKAERGAPKSWEEAVSLAKDAYEEANKHFAAAQPQRLPTREQPKSGAGARTGQAAPTSMFEALKMGVSRA